MPMSEIDDSELISIENTKANAPTPKAYEHSLPSAADIYAAGRGVADKYNAFSTSAGALAMEGMGVGGLGLVRDVGRGARTLGTMLRNVNPDIPKPPNMLETSGQAMEDFATQQVPLVSETWQGMSPAIDPGSVTGSFFSGLGALPSAAAGWTPGMTAVNAYSNVGEGDFSGAAGDVALRIGLGAIFNKVANSPLGFLSKQVLAGGINTATTALGGGTSEEAVASGLMGTLMPLGGSGAKRTQPEKLFNTVQEKFQRVVGVKQGERSGGATEITKEILDGSEAILNTAKHLKAEGRELPKTPIEQLAAFEEANDNIYATKMKGVEALAQEKGVIIDGVADKIEALAKDPHLGTTSPGAGKWYMDKAQAYRDIVDPAIGEPGRMTPLFLATEVQKFNAALSKAERSANPITYGTDLQTKQVNDILRDSLIKPVQEATGDMEYANNRIAYGKIAEAQRRLAGRVRADINKVAPEFLETYAGTATLAELGHIILNPANLFVGAGAMKSRGSIYALKELAKQWRGDSSVKVMNKAASKLLQDSGVMADPGVGGYNTLTPATAQGIDTTAQEDNEMSYIEGL